MDSNTDVKEDHDTEVPEGMEAVRLIVGYDSDGDLESHECDSCWDAPSRVDYLRQRRKIMILVPAFKKEEEPPIEIVHVGKAAVVDKVFYDPNIASGVDWKITGSKSVWD